MIRSATIALAMSAPAMANVDHTHKWYRDRDIPVINAVLQSQLDTPDFIRTGIASFTIETPEDAEDMSHDIVRVTIKPGFGYGSVFYVCDALRKLYWNTVWDIVAQAPNGQGKCEF